MEGDNKLVNIIEDWKDFAKYAKGKVGFYQISGADKNVEIRVTAGKAGFIKEFETATDSLLVEIMDFCKKERDFLQVGETVRDEAFFK
jgi:hypothetical protein